MKKRFSEEQIVAILREGQSGERTIEQLCRGHAIATRTDTFRACGLGSATNLMGWLRLARRTSR